MVTEILIEKVTVTDNHSQWQLKLTVATNSCIRWL